MSSHLRTLLLALGVLAVSLLLAATAPVLAKPGDAAEAGRLQSSLARIAKLAKGEVRPPALRLARGLPGEVQGLGALREPAGTTQAQAGIALGELRQMGAIATLDPHYLPALVAAGRAFVAVSGQDPVTRTAINPDYAGLETELAESEARLDALAGEAARLAGRVKRLTRLVAASRRR
jgi:hypothetical protein